MLLNILYQMGIPTTPDYEYFNGYNMSSPYLTDDGLIETRSSDRQLITSAEMTRRIDILQKARLPYFFKFFAVDINWQLGKPTSSPDVISRPRISDDDPEYHADLKNHPLLMFLSQNYDAIHLIRRNEVAMFLSLAKARRTKVWVKDPWTSDDTEPEPSAISRFEYDQFVMGQQIVSNVGKHLNIVETIFYEDIVDDPTIINNVFGVHGPTPRSHLKIQRTNYDWVSNIDEVRRWFDG
jgi:hypothetical protein